MRLRTTFVSITAATAILATPALATHTATHSPDGQSTSPAKICKSMSKKKTMKGKGKSPYAACVVGVKRAKAARAEDPSTTTSPGKLCKDQSRKRSAADKAAGRKSPHAACVTGAAKAQQAS